MKMNPIFFVALSFAIAFVLSCSGDNGKDGTSCTVEPKANAGEGFDVFCNGEKIGELSNGKDADCIIEPMEDELFVICNHELVGVLRNGEEGASCNVSDDGVYFVMKCGDEESAKWPKAMCGLTAYDPEKMTCDYRDSKTYKYVKIDEQYWLAENMNYNANGSKCYADQPNNCTTYGRLYNWEQAQAACPTSWHLPSDEEWTKLSSFVGSNAGTKLKATSGWNDHATFGNGTDDYSFSALPGGENNSNGFQNIGNSGYWWSASEATVPNGVHSRGIVHNSGNFNQVIIDKGNLLSVRCIRD
ncbi:MAG: hypothetical protein LBU89_00615 [Fibromonadaceae bacterium]|jgi:uncharacterized protein (TIGR02145 family)|nr:hypothetical protein [Fibromonadaceae bacterium]